MTPSGPRVAGRLALESAVIVGSILAAFALDAWWGERQERRDERIALEAMEAEFSSARESILFYRTLQERILVSVASVQDSLSAGMARGDRAVTVRDTALAWAYIPPTTSVTLSTLDGLVASGRLGIVREPRLRAALGSWGSALAELQEEEEASRTLVYGDMDRVLRARINTSGLWSTANLLFRDELDREAWTRMRPLPADTETLGVFHLRRALLYHTIEEFDPLVGEVDSILLLIRQSLGSGRR